MLICHADLGSPFTKGRQNAFNLFLREGGRSAAAWKALDAKEKTRYQMRARKLDKEQESLSKDYVFFFPEKASCPTNLRFSMIFPILLGCHNIEHSYWIGQIKVRMVTLSSVNHCLWFQIGDRHVLLIFKTQETCSREAREAKHSEQSAGQVYCKAQERRWPVLVFRRIPVKKSAVIQSVLCLQLLAGTLKFECRTNKWSFGMDLTKLLQCDWKRMLRSHR